MAKMGPPPRLASCSIDEGLTPQSSGTPHVCPAFRVLCPNTSSPHIHWPSQGRPGALTVGLCGSSSPLASLLPAGPFWAHHPGVQPPEPYLGGPGLHLVSATFEPWPSLTPFCWAASGHYGPVNRKKYAQPKS